MYKKLAIVISLLFLLASCAALDPIEIREQKYGKSIPVISESFASKELRVGDTWKVYLNASDPDGDMRYIVAIIEQPGKEAYPPSYTRIKEENQKSFSGYVYLNTIGVEGFDYGIITLHIQIQDKAGHLSKPVSFPLTFTQRAKQEEPPQGIFKDTALGPIMIKLKPPYYDTDKGVSWH